jgi:hypothetical protein
MPCVPVSVILGLGKWRLRTPGSRNQEAGSHHLHARELALLTDLMHGEQHPPCDGVPPEPISKRRAIHGVLARLCRDGFAVLGFEILHGKPELCR